MRLLRRVLVPTCLALVAVVAVAALLRGIDGAAGAAVGGVLTVLLLGSSPALLNPVARRSPAAALPAALTLYGVKAGAAVVLLAVLLDPSGLGARLDDVSLAAAMVVAALTWVALHLRALRHNRTPTYDV